MTRTPALALALALAIVAGCDSEESSTTPTDELALADTDAAAALEQSPEDDKHRKHRGKDHRGAKHHRNPASHLCDDLGCTEEQTTKIEALFQRDKGERPERPDHSAANTALAKAFRSDGFSVSDLEAHHQASKPTEARETKHLEKMAELHAILDAEQRVAMADRIETEGFMGKGRRGRGKDWKQRDGEKDPERAAARIQRRVESMCEPLSCTDEQMEKLTAIVGQAKADKPERKDQDDHRKALADAMRASSFDADSLRKQFEADSSRDKHHEAKAEMLVALHGVLDETQRDLMAAKIEEHGPRALMGKGHRKNKDHRKDKGRRRGGKHH